MGAVESMPGSLMWEELKDGSQCWMPMCIAEQFKLEQAFQAKQEVATFSTKDWQDYYGSKCPNLRRGDPDVLTYTVDMNTMVRVCDQFRGRKTKVRRVDRDVELTPTQFNAIIAVDQHAGQKEEDVSKLKERVVRLGLSRYSASHWLCLDALKKWVLHDAPLIVHVKFEKPSRDGTLMIEHFLKDDRLRNLFEVGHGCGSQSDGSRNSWESRLFSGALDGASGANRPVYGTINLTNAPCGMRQAHQYGSSYLVLKNKLRWRCTMTNRDSSFSDAKAAYMTNFGGFFERFDDSLFEGIYKHNGDVHLDKYPEIQIHGAVKFGEDVEALVLDKRLEQSVKAKVATFCKKWALPLREHEG